MATLAQFLAKGKWEGRGTRKEGDYFYRFSFTLDKEANGESGSVLMYEDRPKGEPEEIEGTFQLELGDEMEWYEDEDYMLDISFPSRDIRFMLNVQGENSAVMDDFWIRLELTRVAEDGGDV